MRFLAIILLSLSFLSVSAQTVPEIGVFAGGSYYIGDLNPYKHFYNTKFSGSFFYRDQIAKSDRLTFRLQIGFGKVEAFDSESPLQDQVNRNLSFQSKILEVGPMIEIHFLPYEIGSDQRPFTPYLFGGITYFKMNPMGQNGDTWVELQSLGTEGQGTSATNKKNYKLNQVSLPIGIGLKFNMTPRWAFGLEYGIRKTFTDYLDDVSGDYVHPSILSETNGALSAQMADQSINNESRFVNIDGSGVSRGNPNTKDWYAFAGISLCFRVIEYTTCPRKR